MMYRQGNISFFVTTKLSASDLTQLLRNSCLNVILEYEKNTEATVGKVILL